MRSTFFVGDDLTDFPAIEWAVANGVGAFIASEERPRGPEGAHVLSGPEALAAVLALL